MEICNKISKSITNFLILIEKKENMVNLSKFIDKYTKDYEHLNYINSYRIFIRNNNWNSENNCLNDSENNYFESFLKRWEKTQINYINSSYVFYRSFQDNSYKSNKNIYLKALKSEMLRYREGKRSEVGLDNLLNKYINSLDKIFDRNIYLKSKEILDLFTSTLNLPLLSAENELFFDFYKYKEYNNCEITYSNFEKMDDDTKNICSKILRSYCKYSFNDFNEKFKSFSFLKEEIELKNKNLQKIKNKKIIWKEKIYKILNKNCKNDANNFIKILSKIDILNYLNSNIESKFSFKGWPGFIHHLIFKEKHFYPNELDLYSINFIKKGGIL